MAATGSRPVVNPATGEVLGPKAASVLAEPGTSLTPREAFAVGAGKAHRQIVDCGYDLRNYTRDGNASTGRIP